MSFAFRRDGNDYDFRGLWLLQLFTFGVTYTGTIAYCTASTIHCISCGAIPYIAYHSTCAIVWTSIDTNAGRAGVGKKAYDIMSLLGFVP